MSQLFNRFRPLESRTILVTRAAHQATDFKHELESYGARIELFPVIEIAPPDSYAELDAAIENLNFYDWIIFTSTNGVEHFMRRLATLGKTASELDDVRACAIGEATANCLRDFQVHVDVVPGESNAEGVFAALENYLGDQAGFVDLRFLIPRAVLAREYLPTKLAHAGARVDIAAAYRNITANPDNKGRIKAMLQGGAIDCVTFTSSSCVTNFILIFNTTKLSDLLAGITIACIGDITAQTALELGLKVDVLPTVSTTEALAAAIAKHFEVSG